MTVADRVKAWLAPPPRAAKAVTSLGPWASGIPLSLYSQEPQEKAKAYLKAYKVGWFYKAGKKIADDISSLDWSLSEGDMEEGAAETTLDRPDLRAPFASLAPIDQLQRLLERPNPSYTGRQLLRKTQVRLDFAGTAFWYLEGAAQGLPSAIYGISPARMWESRDQKGRIIGWVMDHDSPNPVPFPAREILPFSTGNAEDNDIWGVSVVESVYSQVPLTDLMARHTGDVLALGGRLSGMLWPKERALTEDEFVDAQRAWRNVASDPNAARRMLIFPEPMEWAQGAATPEEIGIPELATLSRDEILTAFPISPYRLGVPTPGGLNSGEVRQEDRKDYWEDTIHPRADLLEETIQVGLVSRYEEATGSTYDFEIAEPNLDNAPSIIEKVGAYKGLVSVGFDPKESVAAVGLGNIKWLGLPASLDPTQQVAAPTSDIQTTANDTNRQDQAATTVAVNKHVKSRDEIAADGVSVLAEFLTEQRDRLVTKLRDTLPQAKAARSEAVKAPTWWDGAKEDAELTSALRLIYAAASRSGLQTVADSLDRIVPNKSLRRVLDDLLTYGATRISDINVTTLEAIKVALAEGTRRGYSIAQLIDGVPAEGFPGVLNVGLDNGVAVWSDLRAETIARTETALSFNRAALNGYKEFRVREVQAIDGDKDEECADRDGRIYSVDDALDIADHPNGTLDWVPVLDKAEHEDRFAELATKALDALGQKPEIHVHNASPEVRVDVGEAIVSPPDLSTVAEAIGSLSAGLADVERAVKEVVQPAPVVNVPAPVVNVPAPIVTVKAPPPVSDVRVVALPDRAHRLVRDKQGKPSGSVETDA